MRIQIDQQRCTGHGRCYAVAPELFDADDSGYGVVINTGDIDPALAESAQVAVDSCPEQAIMLLEGPPAC
jgi:ferredoxin